MAETSDAVAMTNGDVKTNGVNDVNSKTKLVEYETQEADINENSAKVNKFSSKLKENTGVENGKVFREKDYEESAQKSVQEKHGDSTTLEGSSSLQLAEKERVSETEGGGIKSEYTVGSDEQYQSRATAVKKVGEVTIDTNKAVESSFSKSCSKIEETLPGNGLVVGSLDSAAAVTGGSEVGVARGTASGGVVAAAADSQGNKRVTEVSRGDYSHSEQVSSRSEGPAGSTISSKGSLQEQGSSLHSESKVTTPGGSSLQISSSEKRHFKKESFKMEATSGSGDACAQIEQNGGDELPLSLDVDNLLNDGASTASEPATGPKEIKLSTKISSEDGGDVFRKSATANSTSFSEAITESSKFEHVSQKEATSVSSSAVGAATYSRHQPEATPSDNMSVSSMSSAHDINDFKMSSASSSESAFSSNKMETNEMERSRDLKYNRKTTDNLVKRILGETESDRKSKFKVSMGDNEIEEEGETRDSLLQRRLASLDKTGSVTGSGRRRPGSQGGSDYMSEEYEREETTFSRRNRAENRPGSGSGRFNRTGSGDMDSPVRERRRLTRPTSRGSFDLDYDDDLDDDFGYPGYGYGGGDPRGGGYRGGPGGPRGRFARQNYIDDDDVFGAPVQQFQPLFRDEEFEPQKRDETEDYVKEKTASIRGMVDRQTVVLQNLRKASESFDELTDEIRNIRQAFIENQARRSMLFQGQGQRQGDIPLDDEQARDQPRGSGGSRARSRYVQQREEDYEYAMKDARGRSGRGQYGAGTGAEDYGYDSIGNRGRAAMLALEDGSDVTSGYGKYRGMKDYDEIGQKDDFTSAYGRSRGLGKDSDDLYQPKSLAGKSLISSKSSHYSSQEDYSSSYSSAADAYNRRVRGLGGRSKSLYDETSGAGAGLEGDGGLSLGEEGLRSRRARIGLQRTQYDPLSDDLPLSASSSTSRERYGMTSYGGGGTSGGGYMRVGDPLSATSATSAAAAAYGSGSTSHASSYTSRLTSSSASSSSTSATSGVAAASSGVGNSTTRPRFSRSRTLSDIDFDRGSSSSGGLGGSSSSAQGGFSSRFLGKVRQRVGAGEDMSRAGKPFKSRFLRSSFDFGDGVSDSGSTSGSTSGYSSISAKRSSSSSKTETTTETKEGGTD